MLVDEPPPPPLRADGAGLVSELAEALQAAVAAAVRVAGLPEPYVLCIGTGSSTDRWRAWPCIDIGARAFRDTVTDIRDGEDVAVNRLFDGFGGRGAANVELAQFLDAGARRAWCELRAPASCDSDAESERRRTIQRALEAELTRRLNTEPPPDASDPFLALVSFNLLPDTTPEQQRDLLPDEGAYERPWRMAVAAVGAQRVTAFRRSVRGHASAPPPGDPLTDRAALAALLVARGVAEIQATTLADEAEVVLDLVSPPPGAPAPRSRLGGPALLPPGVAWPEGRTFLAGLDLHELRADGLPHAGWLLVFSAMEPGDVTAGVVVLGVAPGEEPVPAQGPALAPHPVCGLVWLRLAAASDDMDGYIALGYERVCAESMDLWLDRGNTTPPSAPRGRWWRRATPMASRLGGGHMLGGRDGSDLVLLQLQSDHALGFVTYGARALELRLSRACAQAGDWSAVRAVHVHNL
jgi:hypothetical protein